MKKGIFALAVTWGCIGYADNGVEIRPLLESDGQIMVQREFMRCPFEKGAFGDDVSLLLPFCWVVQGKGSYVCFSAADQTYSDGVSWELRQVSDGKMIALEHEWTPETDLWFRPFQLFEVKWDGGRRTLLYHHDNYGYASRKDDEEKIALANTVWYELKVGTNGVPKKVAVENGLRLLLKDNAVSEICNVIPHRYQGADAKVVRDHAEPQKRLEMYSRQNWSLSATQKEQIAVLHRDYVKRNIPSGVVSNVYIVAGDGDLDGVCDAYVSTDAEKTCDGNYVWSLYVVEGTRFSRAKESVSRTFERIETVYVDAEVCTSKDSFFRLDRNGMPSYIMPVALNEGKIELWDYVKHESCVQAMRRQKGLSNAMFSDCISPSGCGVASFDDLFFGFAPLVRIKRIPCETFKISR